MKLKKIEVFYLNGQNQVIEIQKAFFRSRPVMTAEYRNSKEDFIKDNIKLEARPFLLIAEFCYPSHIFVYRNEELGIL